MGCTICRGLIPGYTHCFSCFCDQVTDKKQFKEENVGFGLQFQEDILHHTEEGMVVITFHLQSASRVNKKRHRKPQGPCRSDLLTPVRLPPPKGSTIFQNRATSGEPSFRKRKPMEDISHSKHNWGNWNQEYFLINIIEA